MSDGEDDVMFSVGVAEHPEFISRMEQIAQAVLKAQDTISGQADSITAYAKQASVTFGAGAESMQASARSLSETLSESLAVFQQLQQEINSQELKIKISLDGGDPVELLQRQSEELKKFADVLNQAVSFVSTSMDRLQSAVGPATGAAVDGLENMAVAARELQAAAGPEVVTEPGKLKRPSKTLSPQAGPEPESL